MSWIWKPGATSVAPPISRSGCVPVFRIVMYPAPVEAPLGVARDQGLSIWIEPILYSAAPAWPATQASIATANANEYFDERFIDMLQAIQLDRFSTSSRRRR